MTTERVSTYREIIRTEDGNLTRLEQERVIRRASTGRGRKAGRLEVEEDEDVLEGGRGR